MNKTQIAPLNNAPGHGSTILKRVYDLKGGINMLLRKITPRMAHYHFQKAQILVNFHRSLLSLLEDQSY